MLVKVNGELLTQFVRLAIRIALKIAGGVLERLDCFRAGAKRRFVGGELVDAGDTRRMFLARHIGCDIQDTGTRNGLALLNAHGFDLGKCREIRLKIAMWQ